jgi:hypothetical protein
MSRRISIALVALLAVVALALGVGVTRGAGASSVTTFYTGLENPRGLHWGPDGKLYVAEGGTGGNMSTVGTCPSVDVDGVLIEQVPFPVGPYLGSSTGARISQITPAADFLSGSQRTFATGFPSSQTGPIVGSFTSGVADVAWVGNTMYALVSGAGCSHGVAGIPNEIVRVNADGSWSRVADLSAYYRTHVTAQPEKDDYEPDGTPYSMISVRGDLYVVEPNHGELDRVTTSGEITRVVDYSAIFGHVVPTSVAYHGNFYVGNLGTLEDLGLHNQFVAKVTPAGQTRVVASGLQTLLGVAFDSRDRMYVLDMGGYVQGQGRVLRIDPSGQTTVVASGFDHPTGIAFGPDGALYVSDRGFGYCSFGNCPADGRIERVALP